MTDADRLAPWLDRSGSLLPDAPFDEIVGPTSFRVFSQRTDLALDLSRAQANAERFFSAKVGLAHPKSGDPSPRSHDACALMVRTEDGAIGGTRILAGRLATRDDLDDAARAELASRGSGLADLAARCPTVWHVTTDDALGSLDRPSLLIAAVFASVWLGPILAPRAQAIFGVRGAREALANGDASPYR